MSAPLEAVRNLLLVGGGNMGGAMARGWAEAGLGDGRIRVLDPNPNPTLAPLFADGRLAHSTTVPEDGPFDVVVLAVKPQMMADALPPLRRAVGAETTVVSVAAGTSVATIAAALGTGAVVRVMPNTPSLIGRGIAGCFAAPDVSRRARQTIDALLQSCGATVWVDAETDIDAVTAVSGSGPAYVFLLAEVLAEAGVAAGLSPETAMTLARHTLAGAGELLIRSADAPSTLRRNVTSPNGTTQAALDVLMAEGGLAPLMRRAVEAAKRRSVELSKA